MSSASGLINFSSDSYNTQPSQRSASTQRKRSAATPLSSPPPVKQSRTTVANNSTNATNNPMGPPPPRVTAAGGREFADAATGDDIDAIGHVDDNDDDDDATRPLNLSRNSRDWRTWLPQSVIQNLDGDDDDDDGDGLHQCSTEVSARSRRGDDATEDAERTRLELDDDDFDRFCFVPPPSMALADVEDDDDDDDDATKELGAEARSAPVVPMSALGTSRTASTPLRSASQVEDSDTVPLDRSAAVASSSTRKPVPPPPRDVDNDDDDATEELVPLPLPPSASASPVRRPLTSSSVGATAAAAFAAVDALDEESLVQRAREHDSASMSPTDEFYLAKREERAVAAAAAFADTSQWRPQWRPAVTRLVDDDLERMPALDGVSEASEAETVRKLAADHAPDELATGQQGAWRRYQASVAPLPKKAGETPQCDCGGDAVLRQVRKQTNNYGREFWGCGKSKGRCKFFLWADDGRHWDEMSSGARREAYQANVKKTLACQTVLRPEQKQTNLNKDITDILERMRAQYKAAGERMRELGYTKAINAIRRCRHRIRSGEDARKLYGVGERIAAKIDEIVRTGQLRQVDHAVDCEEGRAMELFSKVWGAGPSTARKWIQAGWRTLDDLRANVAQLTRSQQIGLKHYYDFQARIPREEVGLIESIIARICVRYDPGFVVVACGSYRRGKADCGDVDILVTHADGQSHLSILRPLLRKLQEAGYLTDTLTISEASKEREERKKATGNGEVGGTQSSYHGVFRLLGPDAKHRRLDIICVPYNEMGCALLYFTGSDYFNRSMRHYAKALNFSLSQHGIAPAVRTDNGKTKNHVGVPIPTPTELDVFNVLGLEYVEPDQRDPGK